MINAKKLNDELKAAGIEFTAVNTKGIVHGMDGVTEIQERADVAAIIASHDPTEIAKPTVEEKLAALKLVVEMLMDEV